MRLCLRSKFRYVFIPQMALQSNSGGKKCGNKMSVVTAACFVVVMFSCLHDSLMPPIFKFGNGLVDNVSPVESISSILLQSYLVWSENWFWEKIFVILVSLQKLYLLFFGLTESHIVPLGDSPPRNSTTDYGSTEEKLKMKKNACVIFKIRFPFLVESNNSLLWCEIVLINVLM